MIADSRFENLPVIQFHIYFREVGLFNYKHSKILQNLNLLIEKVTKIFSVAIIISRKIRQGQGRNIINGDPLGDPLFTRF